jgi:glycine hydroxymethyltransferase
VRGDRSRRSNLAPGSTPRRAHRNSYSLTLTHFTRSPFPAHPCSFRQIADDNGALLMCDMAHISGLVAAGVADDPFPWCDVVTTTTHKSLRGPRAGMIFVRKDERGFDKRINQAVFPALQGGPHEHQIAGIATQLKEVATPAFKAYAGQVVSNARALAARLVSHGYVMATGGTDNHLVLWDLRPLGLTGSKLEKLCDEVNITLNKNSIYGDRSAMSPGGVRIGTPALTTRGFVEADFQKVADLLHEAVTLALAIQAAAPGKLLTDFVAGFKAREADVAALRKKVRGAGRVCTDAGGGQAPAEDAAARQHAPVILNSHDHTRTRTPD